MSRKPSTLSQYAEGYLHLSSTVQGKFMTSLLSKLSLNPGNNCLDVGFGTGNLTATIAEKVVPNGLVTGCDLNRRRINIAKNYSCRNIKFYEGHLTEIELAKDFFNAAISNLVYHWMDKDEQQRTTEKVFSVLKPNGMLAQFIEKGNPQNVQKIIPYMWCVARFGTICTISKT